MAKPITIPNTFANATTAIPLSQLDNNYSTITASINDANTYSNYAADSGSANAYAVTLSGVSTTYTAGLRIQFKAANTNSGASTLNVNSQGAQAIRLTDSSALPANAIVAGAIVDVMYDGTNFQLLSDSNGGQQSFTDVTVTGNLSVTGTSSFTGNVTIRGGTANNVVASNITISSVATAITAAQGGTGLTSLTANNVILGNGTNSVQFVAPGTSGNVLTSNGTVWVSSNLANSSGLPISTGVSGLGTGVATALGTNANATGGFPTTDGTATLTNKRVTPRVSTTTSSATPTINTDNVDQFGLTAQAVDITSFTTNLSGTPTDGQKLWIYIVGTAARAITWGASFEASTVALPTTTVSTNRLDVGFVWNAATSKWRCVATA